MSKAKELLQKTLSPDQFAELQANLAMVFAREVSQAVLYDPTKSTSRESVTYTGKYSQEQLYRYLQSPTTNEKNLRNASIYMYHTNSRYWRLIQYYPSLPTYAYVITPLNFEPSEQNTDAFRKGYLKVAAKLELMNIRDEARNAILIALREGAFYGVRRSDSSSSFVQTLNPDHCQIRAISDGTFLFSYDMSKIKKEDLYKYPEEFAQMYATYEKDGQKWQPVDAKIGICLKADMSVWSHSLPPFASVLPELFVINDTQALQEASDEASNYKLVSGEVPLDDNGVPVLDFGEVMKYYNQVANNIGEGVGLAFTPFKLQAIDFSKSASADTIDATARAVSNFWSSCGTSAALHGAENRTAGVTKLAVKADETLVFSLLDQYERHVNRYLKTAIGGAARFKISFLPITIFNRDEMVKMYKEGLNYGIGKSHYMAALGIPQYDIAGLAFLENDVLGVNEMLRPMKTASTQTADDSASGGRPSVDDEDLDESGASTRDNDSNANR